MATYAFTINGVAKSLQPGWSITETQNGQNRMDFSVLSLDGSFRVVQDDVIVLTEDGVRIFSGLVDNPGEAGFGGASSTNAITQTVSAVDFNVYANRALVTVEIPAGSVFEALAAIMPVSYGPIGVELLTDFVGTKRQFFIQQAEFYRYVTDEGDPRLFTFFYAATLTNYNALIAANDASFQSVITGMAVDEKASFDAAYAAVVASGWFSGNTTQFLINQMDYYRWVREGDPRLKTFFYGATIAAYDGVMAGLDANMDAIIAAMATDEAAALTSGWAAAMAVQDAGPALPALSYTDRTLTDVLNEIASLASGVGAASYMWEITYYKSLRMFQVGTSATPYNIADGDGHVLGDITVEQPRPSEYGNYAVVLGGTGTKDRTDAFTGDGSTVTFALNYTLATSYGYVTVAGVSETLGTGVTSWSYDSSTNSITRTSAPALGAAISITYVAQFPLRVVSDGGASAAARVVRTYDEPDVFDRTVLQALADSYVTRDMASPKTVRYASAYDRTGVNAVHPGQVQTITTTKRNLSGDHTITEVRIANTVGTQVQRFVTAVTSTRLPTNLRQKFQQAFGSSGTSAAATSITVISGGTFLSSPAPLGGSDTTFRSCDTSTRVPNALPYVAPTTMAVRVRGVAVAAAAANITPSFYDETASSEVSGSPVSSSRTPADFSFDTTVTSGHKYWLHVLSGTAGIAGSACAVLEGR